MKKKIYRTLMIAVAVTGLSSCGDYLDVNTDPSFPQTVNAEVVFPPIFQEMVRGEAFDSRFIGQYVQNWQFVSASNVWDQHGYAPGNDAGGEKWRSHYYGIGVNLQEAIRDGLATGKNGYVGAAKAISAWSWQTTTDYHGEMILKEAFDTARYSFNYDAQEDVYEEVRRLCNEALTYLALEDAVNTFSRGDLAYGGDHAKWTKFVYAILARNAHHISNKASYDPDLVISYVDQSFASNADNFYVPHAGTNADNGNFFGPTRNNMGSYRQSTFVMHLMRGAATDLNPGIVDPRLSTMFTASGDGQYRGVAANTGDPASTNATTQVPNLWGGTTVANVQSRPGKYIYNNAASLPLVTYSELQFIKAEAAFIKGDIATAFTAYRNAITAHMQYVRGFVAAAGQAAFDTNVTNYLASTAVAQNTGELTLSDIMTQKYISLIGHGILETWVDMRRYHYDATVYPGFTFPSILYQDNGGKPAYRVRPRFNSEYVWNRSALDAIGGNNLDYHTYELWFSKPE